MKKILVLSLIAAAAYYFYVDDVSLEGKWTDNGAKTLQSMVSAGEIEESRVTRNMEASLSDATYIFTTDTVGMSFKSNPLFNNEPIPYEVVSKTKSSITISYDVRPGNTEIQTYYFTDDKQCIYIKPGSYKIYMCKDQA